MKEAFRILFSSSYCFCDLFINEQPSEESGVGSRLEEMAPWIILMVKGMFFIAYSKRKMGINILGNNLKLWEPSWYMETLCL